MKKYFAGIAAAAIVSAPFAANALEALDNTTMKSTTGQAGVSIAIDDVVIYQTGIADVTYTDTDGYTSYVGFDPANGVMTDTYGDITSAGIMIDYASNYEKLILIDGIVNGDNYGTSAMDAVMTNALNGKTFADYNIDDLTGKVGIIEAAAIQAEVAAGNHSPVVDASIGDAPGFLNGISPLSIDVGTCISLSEGLSYNKTGDNDYTGTTNPLGVNVPDVAGVVIGLPTVEITQFHNNNTFDVKIVASATESINNAAFGNDTFIQITKSGVSKMAILGGRIEIAPH